MRLYQFGFGSVAALVCACLTLPSCSRPAAAPSQTIAVQVDKPGAAISPGMFGIFFEDINFAADSGIYPERVKNRSFEFSEPLAGWSKIDNFKGVGQLYVRDDKGLNENNPHYLRVHVEDTDGFGIKNTGLRGMGVESGAEFTFSAWVRLPAGGSQTLSAALVDAKGNKLGTASLTGFNGTWKRYETVLKSSGTEEKALLNLSFGDKGDVDLDMVSVYPKNTYKNRPNGLRPDLVQLLADMRPGFLRFPGGCIVEGRRLPLRYQWKKTVGDISERKTIINRWNDEFSETRPTPDYFQSFGLGFYEYFQLAEDIGASPLPVLSCGMACQFNSNELVPLNQLDPYVQDALDLIEFANGAASSKWGGLRASMGHPEPFQLKMIGVGNEQWGKDYVDRYQVFAKAIKSKYPEMMIVTGAGPFSDGKDFDFLWGKMREMKADIVDEHYYKVPQWFLDNSNRYNKYDRNGPKVFAGEYGAQTVEVVSTENRNTWGAAMSEAAFMTGLERNADLVRMASYAPLFAHVEGWQWTPDLIWYDNLRSYGTPNYYVQKLFANHVGSRILPVTIGGATDNGQKGLYASAALDDKTGEVVLKVVNAGKTEAPVSFSLGGASAKGTAKTVTLASADLAVENSLKEPKKIAPVEGTVNANGSTVEVTLPAQSLTVLRVPVK
ncbi:MAG: alpha-L-arabinofuranosidase C-terminal domain-containing protein [Candidatus Solibacter sp.]